MVSDGFMAALEGKNDASTTYKLSTSHALHSGSSTDVAGSLPKQSVPHWWLLVSIGMNLRSLPVTGLTLPFISSGGSSLVTLMFGIGLVESVVLRHDPRLT